MNNPEEQLEYIYPRSLDWAQITKDIADNGCCYNRIAKILGVGWANVQKWRCGSEPGHSVGTALLMIHAKYAGEELTKQRVAEAKTS